MQLGEVKRLARDLCPPLLWKALRQLARRGPPVPGRTVSTVEELEAELVRAEEAGRSSYDDLIEALADIRFTLPSDLPADPGSPEYREAQMAFYSLVSGRAGYTAPECEAFDRFDRDEMNVRPYPYSTRSCITVGEQLMAIGFLVRAMGLSPPGRVLEFGPGFGKLTTELARTGLEVTAVDINPLLLDVLRGHCVRGGLEVALVCAGMLDYRPAERFDRVVFYESFHHCHDHEAMVGRLDGLVAEGGAAVFAGEPIADDFPMPWGVRRDGQSLWAIRREGWLELGFRTDYFLGLLARHGWVAQIRASADVPWQRVFVARRTAEAGPARRGAGNIREGVPGPRAAQRSCQPGGVPGAR